MLSGLTCDLKSGIWVAAYIRRAQIEGAQAMLRRRGADEAGAVFIKVARLDGTAEVFGPAPQSAFDEARPSDRAFIRTLKAEPATEADAEAYLARQIKFDPDIWIVEVEDRAGRNFLDAVVSVSRIRVSCSTGSPLPRGRTADGSAHLSPFVPAEAGTAVLCSDSIRIG